MARTIVFANRKGGSGKTTSTINTADALARMGLRVLVVDADSQAQSTISCGILPARLEMNIYQLLCLAASGTGYLKPLQDTIIRGKKSFDLLPSGADLSALEVEAASVSNRQSLLRDLLLELDHDYDFVLIDLPPSLGLITVNGLAAADQLVIPIEPSFLSMDGLAQMTGILYKVNAELNPGLRLLGILPVKCDLRTNLARSVVAEIKQNFGVRRVLPAVRNDIKLAEAPSFGKTIFEYAPNCRGAMDYKLVAAKIAGVKGERHGL
jgi:chromosome partitioning protein